MGRYAARPAVGARHRPPGSNYSQSAYFDHECPRRANTVVASKLTGKTEVYSRIP
jgi:hypothetical protein